ncbi:hypothetical protein B296_00019976 [Ensete ventricosum]|uniref:Uncharacterized protein n=1 Tax=Ensete ventricosum TaxID=4639 RepID=A0A426YEV5_ENSVE|nr:hypothetical protein B296_00019976 [Ensete ventricosum]
MLAMIYVRKMHSRIRDSRLRVRITIVRFLIMLVPLTELDGVDRPTYPYLEVEGNLARRLHRMMYVHTSSTLLCSIVYVFFFLGVTR